MTRNTNIANVATNTSTTPIVVGVNRDVPPTDIVSLIVLKQRKHDPKLAEEFTVKKFEFEGDNP